MSLITTLRQRPSESATERHAAGRCWPAAATDFSGAQSPAPLLHPSSLERCASDTTLEGTHRPPFPHAGNESSLIGGPLYGHDFVSIGGVLGDVGVPEEEPASVSPWSSVPPPRDGVPIPLPTPSVGSG